jgi:hypothetical protein
VSTVVCQHCGCETAIHKRARSSPDHRRFFGMIAAAFRQWPENEFQFSNSEQLRAYLLVSVGHYDVIPIPAPEKLQENPGDPLLLAMFKDAVAATCGAMRRQYGFASVTVSATGAEIRTPRSIDYDTVSQREFGPIRDAVSDLIETTLGVQADQLLREKAA